MMIELLKSQQEVSNATNLQLRLTVGRMSSSMKSMEVTISELRATIANLESLLQERDNSLSKAPLAPLQNSNYDGSFIAGIAQLRYLYSMPVERIVAYFNENGFDLDKQTAHGLLKKTADLFDNLYKAVKYFPSCPPAIIILTPYSRDIDPVIEECPRGSIW